MISTASEYQTKLTQYLNDRTREYNEGNPTITDTEWDKLFFQLAVLEKRSGIRLPESPTVDILWEKVDGLKTVRHNHPMLSLGKTKDWDEFLKYFKGHDAIGMAKLDGLTCSLRYFDGKLVSAETRGNGEEGEDITHNIKVIPSVPKVISSYFKEIVIDGEIICTYKDFERFSTEYENPRNFAAGSIRLLDSGECAARSLTFVAWKVIGMDFKTFIEELNFLEELRFKVVPWTSSFDLDAKDYLIEQSKILGYPIDGLVGRFDDIEYGQSLGATSHHSNDAFAFKFEDEEVETTLTRIDWGLGRTGVITPVAVFEPVSLGGTTVSRASLHNLSVIERVLGATPYYGQKLRVAKMNMIIPQVVWSDKESKAPQESWLPFPELCPICGGPVQVVTSKAGCRELACIGTDCTGKLINKLDYFLGKKGLDVKGISTRTLERLIGFGWVEELCDIYNVHKYREYWIKKSLFTPRNVDPIIEAIERSRKNVKLEDFIAGLGIPLIGKTVSKELVHHIESWEDFREKVRSKYDWTTIYGFAEAKCNAINNFNYKEADKVAQFMEWAPKTETHTEGPLSGKVICITGLLTHYKNRKMLQEDIEALGGKVSTIVTKVTHILINNKFDSESDKNLKAKKYGVPIMTEDDFLKAYLPSKLEDGQN